MNKKILFILFTCILTVVSTRNAFASPLSTGGNKGSSKQPLQLSWTFDTENPLLCLDQTFSLKWHSIRELPELTEGIIEKGIRTDGYSCWLSINTDKPLTVSAISGWFAIESYPTDTAAFYGLRNKHKQTVSICTDRFGKVMIGLGKDDNYTYIPTNGHVERFKWMHICMIDSSEGISYFLNGVRLQTEQAVNANLQEIEEIKIARDFREKSIGIHNVTSINGIIDEFKLHTTPLKTNYPEKEFKRLGDKTPILAIPSSRFAGDFSRPTYHLLPAANWTNETHGLFLHNGRYHIFNQKNASNLFLGQINWGHFSSPDLINWTEHKPAITPDHEYDMNGIWSGHAVINDEGVPTLIYTTGGEKMGVGLAFPVNSELTEWKKFEGNPVISGQPEGYTRTDLRDQYVWKEGNTWYMIIGFGVVSEGVEKGAVLLYKSIDLKQWEFIHTLYEGNPQVDDSGIFWEMPLFFKTAGKYVLLVNKVPHRGVPARALYWTGDFKDERFIPDNPVPRNLEVINRLLSPSLSYDKDGQLTTIAIIPDEIGSRAAYQHGWTHLYSIPRVWNVQNGKIEQTPHPALEQLRVERQVINHTLVKNQSPLFIGSNLQMEIKVKITPGESKRYGFTLHKNPDNSEYSQIYYDVATNEIVVDQRKSSFKKDIPLQVRRDVYPLESGKPEDFHLFIDGSVVEVFINGKEAFTTRIFPLYKESNQVEVFTVGGDLQIEGEWWKMQSAQMKTNF